MGFPGSKFESEILSSLSRSILAAHKWNLPLTAEMLPRGFERGRGREDTGQHHVCVQAGSGTRGGYHQDRIPGDQESFRELTESVYIRLSS
jgi:DhnA family fructose-bisphosphate aldolase class Ia